MKKKILTSAILVFCTCNFLFAQNPFESLGVKNIKVLTFSNGKFNEFFDNDTIEQIGSILFNTVTNEIVAFVENDTSYSEATLNPEITSRWLSPDPLAAKFPFISPYAYGNNNPIFFIDPDGRAVKAANSDALVILNSVFSTFNSSINGQAMTGAQLFGFSSKDANSATFSSNVSAKQFNDILSQTGLSKSQRSDASALFKVLSKSDVVEIGLANEASSLQKNINPSSNSNSIGLVTENNSADNLIDQSLRGNMNNSQIRQNLTGQSPSGKISSNEAWGYFGNSDPATNMSPGGVKGLILVNNNGQMVNDFTYSPSNNNTNNGDFNKAVSSFKTSIIEFSKTKEANNYEK